MVGGWHLTESWWKIIPQVAKNEQYVLSRYMINTLVEDIFIFIYITYYLNWSRFWLANEGCYITEIETNIEGSQLFLDILITKEPIIHFLGKSQYPREITKQWRSLTVFKIDDIIPPMFSHVINNSIKFQLIIWNQWFIKRPQFVN